jgi:hypothetical protein
MPVLIDIVRQSHAKQRPHRFYAAAGIANASSHPRLASLLLQNGGFVVCREVERQSLANLHILGSKMGDCARTSIYHLSERREGDARAGAMRYRFKWGTKPVMEISFSPHKNCSGAIWCCFILWLLIVVYTFSPVLYNL